MFGDGPLMFQEFMRREPLPVARVNDAVFDFLRGRDDCVLCGAHAVNAYIHQPRMSEDLDLLCARAQGLAAELSDALKRIFQMMIGAKSCRNGAVLRINQVRRSGNRHLVDIHSVSVLPACQPVDGVLVLSPPELTASKVMRMASRRSSRRYLDMADIYRLLLQFPELKTEHGPVRECLNAACAIPDALALWQDLVAREILPDDDDAGY